MRGLAESLLATFFPIPCQVCGRLVEASAQGIACQSCWDQLTPFSSAEICQRCGYPWLAPGIAQRYSAPTDCIYCRHLNFHCARACGRYEGALRASIWQLKIRPDLCQKSIDLLAATFARAEILHSSRLIVPVPLHKQRLRERGFNQAEIIAERLAARVGLPVDAESLARIKATAKHRAGMDLIDRANSVADAFRVQRRRLIKGAAVLLVDDLFTTGSTLSACADALLSAGASQVQVLTLARVTSLTGQ